MNDSQPKENNPYFEYEGLVYARVSSKRQENEGSGLKSQEGRCIKELEYIKVPYRETFRDSYSGGGDFMNRPAMRDLLNYIDKNPHKKYVVIFDDLKRFARDTEFHFKLRTTFKVRGVLLKCLNYNFDDSPEGVFTETIFAAQGQLEREQNKRQVIQKMKARLEAGYFCFNSIKGYKMIKDPLHGKIAVPYEPEAKFLKEAMEGFATGRFVRVIDASKYLVEQGFWKQKPERYTEKLTLIFKDPFYAGDIIYPRWDVERRTGHHKPIISLETYNLIQKRLDKKNFNKRIRIDISNDFCFRGLIVCDECGSHLTGVNANGRSKKYPLYYCQNQECELYRKSFRKEDIEDDFQKLLVKQKLKDDVTKFLDVTFERIWNDEIKDFNNGIKIKEKSKLELREKIKGLTEIVIDKNKSFALREACEKQVDEFSLILKKMEQSEPENIDLDTPYRTALDKATLFLKSPYEYWVNVDVLEKQRMFFFIFDEKLPYSENMGYRTDKIPSAVRLFEEFAVANPLDVEMGGSEPPCKQLLYTSLHV